MPDFIRICAILLAIVVCATLPWAIGYENRPKRVWFLFVCIEGFIFSGVVAMGYHIGDGPVVWYRTPLILFASVAGIIYLILTLLTIHNDRGSKR
jgi:4-hydroxybenzoate polyprenyltransferase